VGIINPKTSSIEGAYYLHADRESWSKRIPKMKHNTSGQTITADAMVESPQYLEIQYCEYLVSLITGKKQAWLQKQ